MVRVTDLTKRYGPFTALDGVTFSVRSNEVLGLIGPNGSGKTTLFECLGGVLPFEGGGVEPRADSSGQPLMFYLPDGIAPWPDQTVRWVLDFAVGYFGGDAAAAPTLIERLALTPCLDQRVRALSKGQRKRALLAVGLLAPHRILLADEPFDGLDLRQAREVASLLRDVAATGRTLFLSIHQISDAARVCDRFILLSNGRVRGEGTIAELAARVGGREPAEQRDSSRRSPDDSPPRANSDLEEVFLALT
jgi:ABC-2 type transport system ATP-binding protein